MHKKRKNPSTPQQNGQRKEFTIQAKKKTIYNEIPFTIDSTPKASAKSGVRDMGGVHQPISTRIPDHEIPANVLDFLGGCVSYSGCG